MRTQNVNKLHVTFTHSYGQRETSACDEGVTRWPLP